MDLSKLLFVTYIKMWIGYGVCLKVSDWSDWTPRIKFLIELPYEEIVIIAAQVRES